MPKNMATHPASQAAACRSQPPAALVLDPAAGRCAHGSRLQRRWSRILPLVALLADLAAGRPLALLAPPCLQPRYSHLLIRHAADRPLGHSQQGIREKASKN
jgi:hypothetical protein